MPRKVDSKKKDLRKLDPNSQEYWEEVLRREGLSMSRGRNRSCLYVGSQKALERIEHGWTVEETGDYTGRVVLPEK